MCGAYPEVARLIKRLAEDLAARAAGVPAQGCAIAASQERGAGA